MPCTMSLGHFYIHPVPVDCRRPLVESSLQVGVGPSSDMVIRLLYTRLKNELKGFHGEVSALLASIREQLGCRMDGMF